MGVLPAGFTALAEKCIQQSGPERGAEELAHVLNAYMGDILEGKSRAAGCRASPRLLEEGVPLTLLFPLSVCRGAGFWRRHPEVCRCVLRRRQSQRPADAQHLPWEPPGFHPAICGEQRGTALSPALSRASTGALRHGRSGGGEGALSLSAEGHWRGGGGWRPHCCPPPPTLLLCCPGGRCSWPGRWEGSLRPGCPGGPSG